MLRNALQEGCVLCSPRPRLYSGVVFAITTQLLLEGFDSIFRTAVRHAAAKSLYDLQSNPDGLENGCLVILRPKTTLN